MKDETLKKLQFEKFTVLLKELMEAGFGEINYKVVIRDKKIDYIALTRTNTYKAESGKI